MTVLVIRALGLILGKIIRDYGSVSDVSDVSDVTTKRHLLLTSLIDVGTSFLTCATTILLQFSARKLRNLRNIT